MSTADDSNEGSNGEYQAELEQSAAQERRARILDSEASASYAEVEAYYGPLPHPAMFAHYERIHPGAAERIFRMTEKQLDHGMAMERAEVELRREVVNATLKTELRAQVLTFVIVVLFLALSGYALFLGQQLAAVAGGLAAIGTIAYALRSARKAGDEKVDDSPGEPTAESSQGQDGA